MVTWFWRLAGALFRKLRPREGWGVFLSLAVMLLSLAGAVSEAGWLGPRFHGWFSGLAGLLLGMFLARKVTRKSLAALTAVIFAAGLALLQTALPERFLLLRPQDALPTLQTFLVTMQQALAAQVSHGPAPLPLAFWGMVGHGIIFLAGAWAGWFGFLRTGNRGGDPWLAALLPAFLLTGTLFFAQQGYFWAAAFIFAYIILTMALNLARWRASWDARGVDYSPEIGLDLFLSGLLIATGVTLTSLAAPNLALTPVTAAFWRVWAEPYALLESRVSPLFQDLERPPRSLVGGGAAGGGGLPRAHLLGAGPELTERVIMTVAVDDPDPGAPTFWSNYRWRGPTYATYTGRGWDNPPPQAVLRLRPGETWLKTIPADRRPLRQEMRFVAGRPYWLYAEGEPVAADIRGRAFLITDESLAGITANVRRYTVLSQAPVFNAEHLRRAPNDYPPGLAVYLQVPETTPARVFDLARRITADTANPYDQAVAIQDYLRTAYPYSLNVPLPPSGRDVVDYFLFDLRRGYCDYYASAMVVMARGLGIPARLAVGYAPGEYDARRDRLVVREKDAHSWPELYFPGYGWVPFEPTPARPDFVPQTTLRRTQEENQLDARAAMRALRWRSIWQQIARWGGLFLLGLVVVLGGRWMWSEWQLRRRAEHPWQLAWLRLERASPRVGVTPAAWLTPRELARAWSQALTARYPGHPAASDLARAVLALAEGVEARAYAPPDRRPSDAEAARAWGRVRSGLRALRFARWRERYVQRT